jgi:hypothetical protein
MKWKLAFLWILCLNHIYGQHQPTIKGEPAETGFQNYYNQKSPYSVEGIDETETLFAKFYLEMNGGVRIGDIDIQKDRKKVYLLPVIDNLEILIRSAPWKPAMVKGKYISSNVEIAVQVNVKKAINDLERLVAKDSVYLYVEFLPEFDGQIAYKSFTEYLLKNTALPPLSKVFVELTILEDGSMKDYKIVESNNEKASELVMETIKNAPDLWYPGFNQKNPIKVRMLFKLEN